MKKSGCERDITEDTLFKGALVCRQYRLGYRFSIDAVLLAHFIQPKRGCGIVDFGAGSGIVSLILAYRRPEVEITAVELQPSLYELLRTNVALNGFADHIRCVHADLRDYKRFLTAGSFDWAVSNPPYQKPGAGRLNILLEEAMARHELQTDLTSLVTAMAYSLRVKGRAAIIYPASRMAVLLDALRSVALEPKRLQIVYGYPEGAARLVLVEAVKQGGEELTILPPFFIYVRKNGPYSPQMQRMYE